MVRARAAAAICLLGSAAGQQASVAVKEEHPPLTVYACSATQACSPERGGLTLDAQYRWVHSADGDEVKNCLNEGAWDKELCPDPKTCAAKCSVEGISRDSYKNTYGVSRVDNGFKLDVQADGGGSRVHLTDVLTGYKILALKNREMSFDVDVSRLPCGLSSILTLTPMDPQGEKGVGANEAGAVHGLGRCDSTCTRSVKFQGGQANLKDWDAESGTGAWGSCCPELRLWEANKESLSMSVHACASPKPETCVGSECGVKCDAAGCKFDPFAVGDPDFFGPDGRIDSTSPVTVVTQFITHDGTDTGELSEVRRFYTQHGKTIENTRADQKKFPSLLASSSISEDFCGAMKQLQGTSAGVGYMGRLSKVLDHGVVLTASVQEPDVAPAAGPCKGASARAAKNASVSFSNFMYGDITSTCPTCVKESSPKTVQDTRSPVAAVTATATTATTARAPPKPFIQTDAFRYITYAAGALLLGLVCSTCCSSSSKPGWTVSGTSRGGGRR